MLEDINGYELMFVQKASPTNSSDAFDFALIYKFFTTPTKNVQRLKYIIRVELHKDVFAIKFYAARDRKKDNKYQRLMNIHGYRGTLNIFMTCASLVPALSSKYPQYSFVINGARSVDLERNKEETSESNQRFRIYKTMAIYLFGEETFEHFQFKEISSYLLVRKERDVNTEDRKNQIKNLFLDLYDIEDQWQ